MFQGSVTWPIGIAAGRSYAVFVPEFIAYPVLEAAVTPRPEGGLLRPQAHVVLTEGRQGSEELAEELRQHVRSKCAGFMVPRQIHFVQELPKTATGKIQRYVLRGEST